MTKSRVNNYCYLDHPSGKHLRIVAEPGIGKTRLVLEALGAKRFSTACIYVDRPSAFTNSRSFHHILDKDCSADIFLVVDECDEETMLEIWNRVKRLPGIRLVTIYNEPGALIGSMESLPVPSLDDSQIMGILESYGVSSHHRAKYCGMCRKSPRAAHAIGSSLKHDLVDMHSIREERVWDLYIASKTHRGSKEFKTRKTILLWISAFRRIGFAGYYTKEYGILQKLLAEHENISLGTFTGTVKKLREMRILQGDSTLYITPKMLHIHLWLEWHEQYHNIEPTLPSYRPEDVSKYSPEANMLEWRTDMFSYAKNMRTDHHIQNLFVEDGYVDRHRLLESEFGAELFYTLAKADIDRAVVYLDRHIPDHTSLHHSRFNPGQRWMAITLLGASMKRSLFEKSAQLLLSLAALGDGDHNVVKIFTSLFVPTYGQRAQTEMPPSERLPLIREALVSIDQKRRWLAIQACDAALTNPSITFTYGQEELWQDPTPWTPKSKMEIPEYYKMVLGMLHSHVEHVQSEEEKTSVIKVILEKGVKMLGDPMVSDKVVDIVADLYKNHHVDAETVIGAISNHTARSIFRPMSEFFLTEVGKLQDLLIGSDYRLMLRQTVAWEVAHDPEDDPLKALDRLARQSLDIKVLESELDWLVTNKAIRGYDFGHALGRLDNCTLLNHILSAQRQSGSSVVDFLAGYLRAVFEKDASRWDLVMNEISRDHNLCAHIPELASMSGITDSTAIRIHDIIREGRLESSSLKSFAHTYLVNELSEPTFKKWMQLLLCGDLESRQTFMRLYCEYYLVNKRTMPDSARDILVSGDARVVASDMYQVTYWCKILKRYTEQHPEDTDTLSGALEFAAVNLAGTGAEDDIYDILSAITAKSRETAWGYVAALFDTMPADPADSNDGKARFVAYLLDGGKLIDAISLNVICGWMDVDAERRAPLAAYVFPDRLDIATVLVSKYGHIGRVKEILTSVQTRPRIPLGNHHTQKIKDIAAFKKGVTDQTVLRWLNDCIVILERGMGATYRK